jgi:hypothetical protein
LFSRSDGLDQPGQRRELHRPLHLDDLDLAPRALEVRCCDPLILGGDANHTQPTERLRGPVGAGDGGDDHRAAPEAEVAQLVDVATGPVGGRVALLHQHVLAGDPDVGGAGGHVGGHVGGAHRDQADVLEQQAALVRAHLAG